MKTVLFLTILLILNGYSGHTQTEKIFPFSVDLETIDGQIINSSTFKNEKQILIIDFWNIGCSPCIKTFNAIRDNYDQWKSKTGTKIIAIAAQSRNEKTLQLIKESNWPFEVFFDPNYNLFRTLSKHYKEGQIVYAFPTMFLFDNKFKLIDKLEGTKQKLKAGAKYPANGETVTGDIFDVDMNFYYDFLGGLTAKK